jgi:hypothetical protein
LSWKEVEGAGGEMALMAGAVNDRLRRSPNGGTAVTANQLFFHGGGDSCGLMLRKELQR